MSNPKNSFVSNRRMRRRKKPSERTASRGGKAALKQNRGQECNSRPQLNHTIMQSKSTSESIEDPVDRALALYWSLPELEPLRQELSELITVLYPGETPVEAEQSDPHSFWEIWNAVRGMLTDSKFSANFYWGWGSETVGHRDPNWVQPHH